MIDHKTVRLGKKAARFDSRTLRLAKYLTPQLPLPPLSVDWTKGVSVWGMMKNDTVGDCTIAAAGHMIEVWTGDEGKEKVIPDSQIIKAYSDVSGYNPHNGSNDNGADMLTVLKYWQSTGIGGDEIDAFTSVDPGNLREVRQAVDLFGGCYIGVQLPISAQGQNEWHLMGGLKKRNYAPGGWGGHCIPIVKYGPEGLWVVTWGQLLLMGHGFFEAYCDEAYAIFDFDWLNASKVAPNGLDLATLNADLQLISQ